MNSDEAVVQQKRTTPAQEEKEYGEVEIRKTEQGWLIQYLGEDLETKYLPPNPAKVRRQIMAERLRYRLRAMYKRIRGRREPAGQY